MTSFRWVALITLTCCAAMASAGYCQAPVANFVGSNCAGPPSLMVSFTDISTNNPTSWWWDFGDESYSDEQNPTHTYTELGNYTVTLTATNAYGSHTRSKADFAIVTTNRVVHAYPGDDLRAITFNTSQDGDVIMIHDGVYEANDRPWMRLENRTGVILRGASGDASLVTLQGYGWASKPSNNNDLLWVYGSSDITVAFLHFEEARSFGIKVTNLLLNGRGVENLNIHDCSFLNIGVRMIKGTGGDLIPVQTGSVRQCHFENTKIPAKNWSDGGNYITAIDMMVLRDWTFADNVFKNIKGRTGGGRAAIFVWVESQNVVSERNVIIGCDRSIAYGNPSTSSVGPTQPHMTNGVIRNNFIVNDIGQGIELCWVNGIKAYHNTILTPNEDGQGIQYHWNLLQGIHIANNLVRGQIYGDEGADVTLEGNLQTGIQDDWFADVSTGDLHLTALATPAIDQVNWLADAPTDFDQEERPTTAGMVDIGADECTVEPGPPVADFSGYPTSGAVPLEVAFTDLSSGNPTSWWWDFGDETYSEEQDPIHIYSDVGLYTVSLTATNDYGFDTETKTDYIDVTEEPQTSCHVGSIALVGKYKGTGAPSGRGYYVEATITVHDQDCETLEGVTVDVTWSGCVSGTGSGVTDENGQVVLTSPVSQDGGTFTCTVDDLTKSGYPYNSGANHETSRSLQNP